MHFYSLNVNMINCYGVNNYLIMPLNSFKLQNISNIQKIINPCTLPILFCLFDSDFLEIKCSSLVFSDPCSFLLQSHFTVGRCVRFLPSWGFILSALCLCPWRVCGRLFFWSWRCFPPWHPWPPASSLTCCLSSSLPGFLTAIGSFCYFEQLCCCVPFPSKCGRCSGGMNYSGIPGNRMCKLLVYMMSDCSLTWLHVSTSHSTVRGFWLVLATHA